MSRARRLAAARRYADNRDNTRAYRELRDRTMTERRILAARRLRERRKQKIMGGVQTGLGTAMTAAGGVLAATGVGAPIAAPLIAGGVTLAGSGVAGMADSPEAAALAPALGNIAGSAVAGYQHRQFLQEMMGPKPSAASGTPGGLRVGMRQPDMGVATPPHLMPQRVTPPGPTVAEADLMNITGERLSQRLQSTPTPAEADLMDITGTRLQQRLSPTGRGGRDWGAFSPSSAGMFSRGWGRY